MPSILLHIYALIRIPRPQEDSAQDFLSWIYLWLSVVWEDFKRYPGPVATSELKTPIPDQCEFAAIPNLATTITVNNKDRYIFADCSRVKMDALYSSEIYRWVQQEEL